MDITNDVSAVLSTDTLFSVAVSPGKLVVLMDLTCWLTPPREHLADLAKLKKTVARGAFESAKELAEKQEAAFQEGDCPIEVFFFTSADEAAQMARSLSENMDECECLDSYFSDEGVESVFGVLVYIASVPLPVSTLAPDQNISEGCDRDDEEEG